MKFYHHFTKRLPAMLPYLRLFRISNIFTVIADTTAAFLLVHGSLSPAGGWLSLMVASCLIYTAGMILNDVFDLEVDQQQRPERPLPSGAIPVTTAKRLGFGFLGLGVLVVTLAGFLLTPEGNGLSTLCWAVLLALAVVGYDAGLKRTQAGPIAMGSCRTFNFLMAMSLAGGGGIWDFDSASWCVALGIGIYVAGITWFARTEATTSGVGQLLFGLSVMILGLLILGSMTYVDQDFSASLSSDQLWYWPGLITLIGITVCRRCVLAIVDPKPRLVQTAVKQSLLSLIVFDSCIVLFALPSQPFYSIFMIALLIPTLWLGRWIRST